MTTSLVAHAGANANNPPIKRNDLSFTMSPCAVIAQFSFYLTPLDPGPRAWMPHAAAAAIWPPVWASLDRIATQDSAISL